MSSTDPIAALLKRIEELERRVRRMVYDGVVTDVDHKKGLVRVDDALATEGEPHKTDWLPWAEHAGKIKTRTMPSVGQSVRVISSGGDPTQGMVTIGWFNENNKMPKAEKGEHVFVNGTRYKHVIHNGPEDSGASGDGSDSVPGQQASPAQTDTVNGDAKGIHETRVGVLDDDEGSWGDGQTQVRPSGDKNKYVEHSRDDITGHIHFAKDSGEKSKRTQIATMVQQKVDEVSIITQIATNINADVDGKQVDITDDRVNTVGKTTLNNGTRLVTYKGAGDGQGEPIAQGNAGEVYVPT